MLNYDKQLIEKAKEKGLQLEDDYLAEFAELTSAQLELLREINEGIQSMTGYGVKTVKKMADNVLCMTWSNGSEQWWVSNPWKGNNSDNIRLDANMFQFPKDKLEDYKAIRKFLIPLPLYYMSVDAKLNGEAPRGTQIAWLLKPR